MNNITMPDFRAWAKVLTYGHADYKIQEALKQAFEQGRTLGYREAIRDDHELDDWFIDQDHDLTWQLEFGVLEQQIEDLKKKNETKPTEE